MEERMKELKKSLSNGELANFVFTEEMKMSVVRNTRMRSKRKKPFLSNIVPRSLTAVALLLFSGGIYYVISNGMEQSTAPTPDHSKNASDVDEQKPVLVSPSFIPEGYVFQHSRAVNDLYENRYVKEADEREYFSYQMQKSEPETEGEIKEEVRLTEDLTGKLYMLSEDHWRLVWEDEGFYQTVEQDGGMSDIDFYKIVDSILVVKGKQSIVSERINELVDAKEAAEAEKVKMAFDEEKAVALLVKYKETRDRVFSDVDDLTSIFRTYHTKDEFCGAFTDFMSREYVESIFDYRIKEEDGGLTLIPMDSPPSFSPEAPYELDKISATEYQLTQYQESDMYGKQNLIFMFKYTSGKWIIDRIDYKTL